MNRTVEDVSTQCSHRNLISEFEYSNSESDAHSNKSLDADFSCDVMMVHVVYDP